MGKDYEKIHRLGHEQLLANGYVVEHEICSSGIIRPKCMKGLQITYTVPGVAVICGYCNTQFKVYEGSTPGRHITRSYKKGDITMGIHEKEFDKIIELKQKEHREIMDYLEYLNKAQEIVCHLEKISQGKEASQITYVRVQRPSPEQQSFGIKDM